MNVPPVIASIFDELDPAVRQRKISNSDVLRMLCFALKTGVPWRYLPTSGQCDWSTAYKRYKRWIRLGLFDKALSSIRSMYANRRLSEDPSWFKELFIDCSFVKNVGGVDCLGKNPTDRGRLATKLSAVVDNNMMPLSCEYFPGNTCDCSVAIETIDKIGCKVRVDKRYKNTIVGDKGYVSQNIARELKKRNMKLLTPVKKGMTRTKKLVRSHEELLRKRHKVENFFCRLDKFKKIHCRHEKSLESFKALSTFAISLMFANHPIIASDYPTLQERNDTEISLAA